MFLNVHSMSRKLLQKLFENFIFITDDVREISCLNRTSSSLIILVYLIVVSRMNGYLNITLYKTQRISNIFI